jgi:4'-phosphopantetheinyl transferase EntD
MKTISMTPGNTAEPKRPPWPSQNIGSMTAGNATTAVVTAADRSRPTLRHGKRHPTREQHEAS